MLVSHAARAAVVAHDALALFPAREAPTTPAPMPPPTFTPTASAIASSVPPSPGSGAWTFSTTTVAASSGSSSWSGSSSNGPPCAVLARSCTASFSMYVGSACGGPSVFSGAVGNCAALTAPGSTTTVYTVLSRNATTALACEFDSRAACRTALAGGACSANGCSVVPTSNSLCVPNDDDATDDVADTDDTFDDTGNTSMSTSTTFGSLSCSGAAPAPPTPPPPTTEAPVTGAPVMYAPVTVAPTSLAQVGQPMTVAPTSLARVTTAPTSNAPSMAKGSTPSSGGGGHKSNTPLIASVVVGVAVVVVALTFVTYRELRASKGPNKHHLFNNAAFGDGNAVDGAIEMQAAPAPAGRPSSAEYEDDVDTTNAR